MFLEGRIEVKENLLNLDLTLLGGQSFRWKKCSSTTGEQEWRGVAYDDFWILTQNVDGILFKVLPVSTASCRDINFYQTLLERYFRLSFDLSAHVDQWRMSHEHFNQIANNMKAVRVLDQEPLENILSFICSQNNHIKRISSMINWLCSEYGEKICHFDGQDEFTFPSLDRLVANQAKIETNLLKARFGYRAKFVSQTVAKISQYGGNEWFEKLRNLSYAEARAELVTLPGIGSKVADCICLMSLNHLESVPIDTHIFKVAQTSYLPHLNKMKTVTPKVYEEISNKFRSIYGPYAGWAQAILFCSELQQFQKKTEVVKKESHPSMNKKKKIR